MNDEFIPAKSATPRKTPRKQTAAKTTQVRAATKRAPVKKAPAKRRVPIKKSPAKNLAHLDAAKASLSPDGLPPVVVTDVAADTTIPAPKTGDASVLVSTASDHTEVDRHVQRRQARWAKAAVVFVIVILCGAVGTLAVLNGRDRSVTHSSRDATRVITASIESLLSYTPANLEANLDSELHLTTGDFRARYSSLVRTSIGPTAVKDGATARAKVVSIGVVNASTNHVVLLAYVDVTLTTTKSAKPTVGGSRVRVTASKVDGKWRISDFLPI